MPPELPALMVAQSYINVELVKQSVKRVAIYPLYLQGCHSLMTKHDNQVNDNQPTKNHAEKREN